MADARRHFCSCKDTACPFNPNNPKYAGKDIGCDACIKKNLALGEVSTRIFVTTGDISGWDDWSREGFAKFVALNPRSEMEQLEAKRKAQAFETSYKAE